MDSGYEANYIKKVGSNLWQQLSTVFATKVTKNNIRVILTTHLQDTHNLSLPAVTPDHHAPHLDWGDANPLSTFWGRQQELMTLEQWVTQDRCNLITIQGIGGIGKSALAVKLAHQLQDQFNVVIWRSLKNLPPLTELMADLLLGVSHQQLTEIPNTPSELISLFVNYLQQQPCLIVLDNAESLLQTGEQFGTYQPGYEDYGKFLRQIGEAVHQSCLLLTTRELPEEIAILAGELLPIRVLKLAGLGTASAHQLLEAKGLMGTPEGTTALINFYRGNPLALKIVATSIQDIFAGNIAEFLDQGNIAFKGIQRLLHQQFQRLSDLEVKVMNWLAIHREPMTPKQLLDDLTESFSPGLLYQTLEALSRRSLIEQGIPIQHETEAPSLGFTLQPMVMEYIIDQLVAEFSQDIVNHQFSSLNQYALVQVIAHEYVRETQIRLMVEPILQRLEKTFKDSTRLVQHLKQFLAQMQTSSLTIHYAAGNVLNLLRRCEADISDLNLSQLTIQQADLRSLKLHRVNFAQADLKTTLFSETLGSIFDLAFSPEGDVLAIATNEEVKLYHYPQLREFASLVGHRILVWSLAFSEDGLLLASSGIDHTIKIWNVSTGLCLHTLEGHQAGVFSVAFEPQGSKGSEDYILASASHDGSVKLWNVSQQICLQTLQVENKLPRKVSFDSIGEKFVVGYVDGSIRVSNSALSEECWLPSDIGSPESPLSFNPSNQTLAMGYGNGLIKLWNVSLQQCENVLEGHTSPILSLEYCANGQILASGSADNTVRLWDAQTGQCLKCLLGHFSRVSAIAWHPSTRSLVSGSEDSTVKVWNKQSGQLMKHIYGHNDCVWTIAFSPNQPIIAVGSNDRGLRIWDTQTGQCLHDLAGHTGRVKTVAYSADGQLLVSVTYGYEIKVWDPEEGRCLQTLQTSGKWCWDTALSHDGRTLAMSGGDNEIQLKNLGTGQQLAPLVGHQDYSLGIAFSPDSQRIASTSWDQTVKLWDLSTGECLQTIPDDDWAWTLAYHPFEPLVVTGCNGGTVKLWDITNGQCLNVLKGHQGLVMTVCFSPDGQTIVSGSADRTIKLWDRHTGQCLQTLVGHADGIFTVAFSSFNQTLASGSVDESVRIWDFKSGECLQTLRFPRLYEDMNIREARGLTSTQINRLKKLGATV
ncbi:WD40 domain-containing protein [Acaryochloris marina]|nr:NB-ARC domain-containing protein [Acaryochloris marina]